MWVGLQSLEKLSLFDNGIKEVPKHVIAHMPRLQNLDFSTNVLKTISADIFNPADYPDSNGRPAYLNLGLHPVHCDSSLCWLKKGEEDGTIKLGYGPRCTNGGGFFKNADLNCTGT